MSESGFELTIQRSAVGQTGEWIGVRLVLRLLETGRIEDDRGRLVGHAPQDPPMLVGKAAGDRVIDDQAADEASLESQRARQERGQLLAMRTAAVGARGQPQRNLAPRLGFPLEQRFGARSLRVAADISVGVVAKEQRAGDERNEPADLVLNQRHCVGDAKARAERLRDLVERLLFTVRTGDVLQRIELLGAAPRSSSTGVAGRRGERCLRRAR